MKHVLSALIASSFILASPASAQLENFQTGPVFTDFGPTAKVQSDIAISKDAKFNIAFDVGKKAEAGKLNRTFESAARFINMHVAAGVAEENIKITIVIHGSASHDLTLQEYYAKKTDGANNANASAIAELQKHGVEFHLCGQSAAAHKIKNSDLLPGVKMQLSAMTAHALLQQQGYTLNPF